MLPEARTLPGTATTSPSSVCLSMVLRFTDTLLLFDLSSSSARAAQMGLPVFLVAVFSSLIVFSSSGFFKWWSSLCLPFTFLLLVELARAHGVQLAANLLGGLEV